MKGSPCQKNDKKSVKRGLQHKKNEKTPQNRSRAPKPLKWESSPRNPFLPPLNGNFNRIPGAA